MKPFNLEAFKAGQKAIHVNSFSKDTISFLTVSSKGLIVFEYDDGVVTISTLKTMEDCYVMISRHQHLIDSYDPDDTWQFKKTTEVVWDYLLNAAPEWLEGYDYRIHPHNDLIKAFKSGKEIVATNTDGNEIPLYRLGDLLNPHKDWDDLRIKPEPEFEYPIYKESNDGRGLIVKFSSLTQGEVVERGNTCYTVGQIHNYWYEHTKDSFWQDWTPSTETTEVETAASISSYHISGSLYTFEETVLDLVSMVSRHQHLIDSYNPEDTWQVLQIEPDSWQTYHTGVEPEWDEECEYRLHPHNDLIKAWKKGAKIEACISSVFIEVDNPEWSETITYRIKPEPTIHCLCYNPGHVHGEFSWSPSLATKQLAIKNGWTIIQEWEV